jgi:hypothetical protein
MRPHRSLRHWVRQLLPTEGRCAQAAAWELVRALQLGFTVQLTQLARQLDRPSTAKSSRQRLARWLGPRAQWQPSRLYGRLLRLTGPVFRGRCVIPLLIDATDLSDGWQVLQVSVPFQRRALPVYRAVRAYAGATETQRALLDEALQFLRTHLPGPRSRYVLVLDRGFPSHTLVRQLQATGWRFVMRLKGNGKLTHPEYTGPLHGLATAGAVSVQPTLWSGGVLGDRTKGAGKRVRWCEATVVAWHGAGHAEPWYLVTSEADAALAVALYRTRMQIEGEFRDLKGPLGLDALAAWHDPLRVARFLAWMAVYEWRLAYLWLMHKLAGQAPQWRIGGALSWIRTTREWLLRQLRRGNFQPDACL